MIDFKTQYEALVACATELTGNHYDAYLLLVGVTDLARIQLRSKFDPDCDALVAKGDRCSASVRAEYERDYAIEAQARLQGPDIVRSCLQAPTDPDIVAEQCKVTTGAYDYRNIEVTVNKSAFRDTLPDMSEGERCCPTCGMCDCASLAHDGTPSDCFYYKG